MMLTLSKVTKELGKIQDILGITDEKGKDEEE